MKPQDTPYTGQDSKQAALFNVILILPGEPNSDKMNYRPPPTKQHLQKL
jgi:hypothetical protein